MFLNGLKAKSILRKLKSYSADRRYAPSYTSVKRVGLLQEEHGPFDADKITILAKALGIKEGNIEMLTYVKTIRKEQKEFTDIFSDKHIGWKGLLKPKYLKTYGDTRFDVLLSYYNEDQLALRAVTGFSKAIFKVGIYKTEHSLNDLIIETDLDQTTVFINELEKYLKILKII